VHALRRTRYVWPDRPRRVYLSVIDTDTPLASNAASIFSVVLGAGSPGAATGTGRRTLPATRTLAVRIHCSPRVSGRLPTGTSGLTELSVVAIGPDGRGGGARGPVPPLLVCVVPPTCSRWRPAAPPAGAGASMDAVRMDDVSTWLAAVWLRQYHSSAGQPRRGSGPAEQGRGAGGGGGGQEVSAGSLGQLVLPWRPRLETSSRKWLVSSLNEMATLVDAPAAPGLAPSTTPPGGRMTSDTNVMLSPRSRLTPTGQLKLVKLIDTAPFWHRSEPELVAPRYLRAVGRPSRHWRLRLQLGAPAARAARSCVCSRRTHPPFLGQLLSSFEQLNFNPSTTHVRAPARPQQHRI